MVSVNLKQSVFANVKQGTCPLRLRGGLVKIHLSRGVKTLAQCQRKQCNGSGHPLLSIWTLKGFSLGVIPDNTVFRVLSGPCVKGKWFKFLCASSRYVKNSKWDF